MISFCNLAIIASSAALTSNLFTFYIMFLALSANLRVLTVSSTDYPEGLTVAIKNVFVPPEKVSCSNLVSLESL